MFFFWNKTLGENMREAKQLRSFYVRGDVKIIILFSQVEE